MIRVPLGARLQQGGFHCEQLPMGMVFIVYDNNGYLNK